MVIVSYRHWPTRFYQSVFIHGFSPGSSSIIQSWFGAVLDRSLRNTCLDESTKKATGDVENPQNFEQNLHDTIDM